MELEKLIIAIKGVLPILDSNMRNAYKEYMQGAIPAGAYSYVHDRHFLAHSIVNGQPLDADTAYKACALLAVDIRTGRADALENNQWQQAELQWWDCFRQAGFTAINKHFNCPMQNKETSNE